MKNEFGIMVFVINVSYIGDILIGVVGMDLNVMNAMTRFGLVG